MAHKSRHSTSSSAALGLEDSIRRSWSAGSRVRILSSVSNEWVGAHIVTMHKDWLYCLLDDGDTKKVDRYDICVQPFASDSGSNSMTGGTTATGGGGGEDDDDIFWLKDVATDSQPTSIPKSRSTPIPMANSKLNALSKPQQSPMAEFHSGSILEALSSSKMDPLSLSPDASAMDAVNQKMCGYTVWVQWCDAAELHGYYHCVGLRNDRFHFVSRRDAMAELFADGQGYWYLMYDGQCLYKSKGRGHDDPPPRSWRCIEGSLPPPGVSTVDLPEDSRPMVIIDDSKREHPPTKLSLISIPNGNGSSSVSSTTTPLTPSTPSAVDRMRTVQNVGTPSTPSSHISSKSMHHGVSSKQKKKRKKKNRKTRLNLAKAFRDEFECDVEVFDFAFDGANEMAFHLNIGVHMEVTKVKEGGQAETLGVLQGDILLRIDGEDVSKNWESATNLLRTHGQNREQFTITFVRRKVENLVINVVRSGNVEYNGKYRFLRRDRDDDFCPIWVKHDRDDDFDFTGIHGADDDEKRYDPLTCGSDSVHLIQRVYSNPENSESLWVLRNGKDEHYYMAFSEEYLPPQHGWELVPDSGSKYPAPGLQFTSSLRTFGHVDRLKKANDSESKSEAVADDLEERSNGPSTADSSAPFARAQTVGPHIGGGDVHDALNINNRNRTNKHRHEKTLTRMRATLGSAAEFNAAAASSANSRSHTGGGGVVSKYMMSGGGVAGKYGAGSKRRGFGSKLYGNKKKKNPVVAQQGGGGVSRTESSGNESAPETDDDTAKIEAVWKQRLEATTKNAINQLQTQHEEEMTARLETVETLNDTVDKLRSSFAESNEFYYQLWLEKCELSLVLQEKQVEVKRSRDKQKEMGKRYFQQKQRSEELQSKLNQLSSSFSSRMSAIQSAPRQHRPTKSTVNDLAAIEQQFRDLLRVEHSNSLSPNSRPVGAGHSAAGSGTMDSAERQYLENELVRLQETVSLRERKVASLEAENDALKSENVRLQKRGGSESFYAERADKLKRKCTVFQQNIYGLMGLLQTVEQEYLTKCGKLPKGTRAVNWRDEYDPKHYRQRTGGGTGGSGGGDEVGGHRPSQTLPGNVMERRPKSKKLRKTKSRNKMESSSTATDHMEMAHEDRWGGFGLGSSGDDPEKEAVDKLQKPRHRGKQNGSIFMDL